MATGRNILIVDDHQLFAESLKFGLEYSMKYGNIEFITNPNNLIRKIKDFEIDLLLLDINLNEINGLDLIHSIKSNFPKLRILVLTSNTDLFNFNTALNQNANGIATKNLPFKELLQIIDTILSGNNYFEQQINQIVETKTIGNSKITKRELEIIKLLSEGNSNFEICNRLNISIRTLETHKKNVFLKLNVKSTSLLIKKSKSLDLI